MLHLPPLPPWEALHPLVIHFPIALLVVAPLFILASALVSPARGRSYLISGIALLLLGTGCLFVAAATGEAAAELADRTAAVNKALEAHEHLAGEARIVFSILSAGSLAIAVLPLVVRRARGRLYETLAPLVFLGAYSLGLIVLVNTAHAGGRLVHQFGVHSMMPQESSVSPGLAAED